MILRRSLILTLALLFLMGLGMFTVLVFQENWQMQAAEAKQGTALQTAFDQELSAITDQAEVIASQIAANPEIQAALAGRDRQRLLELSQPGYAALAEEYDLVEYIFIVPPGTIFIDLSNPGGNSEDDTVELGRVTETSQRVTGINMNPGGLAIRIVVPISSQGRLAGSLNIALGLRSAFMERLKTAYGLDWQLSLVRYMASPQMLPHLAGPQPSSDLALLSGTRSQPVFASPKAYQVVLAQGIVQSSPIRFDGQAFRVLSIPLKDSQGQVVAVLDAIQPRSAAIQTRNRDLAIQFGFFIFALLVSGLGAVLFQQNNFRSLQKLDLVAAELASSSSQARDAVRRAPETAPGEIGRIGFHLNRLAARVRSLERDLESQIASRTAQQEHRIQQVQRAAELARELAPARSLEELLGHAVSLISARFGFDRAAIFLIDETNEYARLAAASGSQGHTMLASGLKVRIGQVGPVGYATAMGKLRAAAIDADPHIDRESLLPGARFQLALPLRTSTRLIGALDLQSITDRDLESEETAVLQTVADQLAFAIERNLLLEQADRLQSLESQPVMVGAQYQADPLSYEYDGIRVVSKSFPQGQHLPASARERLSQGETVIHSSTSNGASRQGSTLLVPIRLYEELIGVIGLEDSNAHYVWPADVIAITEAIANQAAQTLENARLYQETQEIANRERLIAEISGKMQRAVNVEDLLTRTLQDLQTSLGAAYAVVRLNTDLIGEESTPGIHPAAGGQVGDK